MKGAVVGRDELRFGDYVVALTRPGSARRPNGIECAVNVNARGRVAIGDGRLVVGRVEISPGPGWNPVPVFAPIDSLPPGAEPLPRSVGSWIGGTDPAADALLAGFVAGLVLLHGQRTKADKVAARAIALARPARATLLRHAARGEVPEPIHHLLASRNTGPLISSSTLGIAWLRGFISAGLPLDPNSVLIDPRRRTA